VQIRCPNPACKKVCDVAVADVELVKRPVSCPHCGTRFTVSTSLQDGPRIQGDRRTQSGAARETADGIQSAPAKLRESAKLPEHIGRFQVRALLGAGAFGTVYRAYDPQLDREVALKVPQAGVLDSPKRIERFLREAKASAQLRHPHIIPIYDAGHDGSCYYMASAFIEGRTLADTIDEGELNLRRAVQVVRDLAEALAYAHELGIVHRDVKPANVMVDAKGQPLLMDFGLAHRQDTVDKESIQPEDPGTEAREASGKLTRDGAVLGTPAYMAPEQAQGKPAQPASDQYSLGVILYELLCGQTPFSGPIQIVLFNVVHTEPNSPRSTKPEIPLDLETICLKAMSKRPEDRFASCQELADDLRRWLDGEPIHARRMGRTERVVRWFKREPALAIATAVAAACLIAVAVIGTLSALEQATLKDRAIDAKNEALGEKYRADKAKEDALDAKKEAVEAQKDADAAREKAESVSYLHGIARADRALQDKDVPLAQKLLDQSRLPLRGWEWGYLKGKCQEAEIAAQRKSSSRIPIAYSSDGTYLAAAGKNGTVQLWQIPIQGTPRTIEGLGKEIACLDFSPDNKYLAWGDSDGAAMIMNLGDGQPRVILDGDGNGITSIAFNTDSGSLATGDDVGHMKILDFTTGKKTDVEGHTKGVTNLVFSPPILDLTVDFGPSALICSVGKDKYVRLWRATNGERINEYNGFTAAALSPEIGAAVAYATGKIMVIGSKGEYSGSWQIHESTTDGAVRKMVMSRNGQRIASADERYVKVWSASSGKLIRKFEGAADFALSPPDGKYLAIAGNDGTVWFWDVEAGTPAHFNGDGKPILSDSNIPDKAGTKPAYSEYTWHVNHVAFSPDGRLIATAARGHGENKLVSGEVKVWDIGTGREAIELKGQLSAKVRCVAFNADGELLLAACDDGVMEVWDVTTGRLVCNRLTPIKRVSRLALSREGKYLAAATEDGSVRVLNIKSGQELDVADAKLDSASQEAVLEVSNLISDQWKLVLLTQAEKAHCLALHPDGKRLASIDQESGTIGICDVNTPHQRILSFKESGLNYAVFSPDGTRLAAGSGNGLTIWSAKSENGLPAQPLQEMPSSPLEVRDIIASEPAPDRLSETAAEAHKYLPRDTRLVLTVNVRQVLESEFAKRNARMLAKPALEQGSNLFNALGETGFDPLDDLVRVVVAMPSLRDSEKSLFIVQGKFDVQKFHDQAQEIAKKFGVKLRTIDHNGYKVWEITADISSAPWYVALVNDQILLAALTRDAIDKALKNASRKEKGEATSKELQDLLAKEDPKLALSVIALGDALKTDSGPFGASVSEIRSITVGVFVAKDFKLSLTITPRNLGDSKGIADQIKGSLGDAKRIIPFVVGQHKELVPMLEDAIDRIKTDVGNEGVTLRAEWTQERVKNLLPILIDQAQGTAPPGRDPPLDQSKPKPPGPEDRARILTSAKQLAANGLLDQPAFLCRQIIQECPPADPSIKEAQELLDTLVRRMASRDLRNANGWYDKGFHDVAGKRYQEIIKEYPGSDEAKEAQDRLRKLKK
jgi:eukaryotic-like serine/threonine-protein kinase